jgi:hypothetical protein
MTNLFGLLGGYMMPSSDGSNKYNLKTGKPGYLVLKNPMPVPKVGDMIRHDGYEAEVLEVENLEELAPYSCKGEYRLKIVRKVKL